MKNNRTRGNHREIYAILRLQNLNILTEKQLVLCICNSVLFKDSGDFYISALENIRL